MRLFATTKHYFESLVVNFTLQGDYISFPDLLLAVMSLSNSGL